jgi:uncharacterized protein (DUF433 family)
MTGKTGSNAYTDPNTLLERHARQRPGKTFIESPDQGSRITFGEFEALTRRCANFLAGEGVRHGDRISVLSDNGIEPRLIAAQRKIRALEAERKRPLRGPGRDRREERGPHRGRGGTSAAEGPSRAALHDPVESGMKTGGTRMAMLAPPHIRHDEQGVAWIDDTNVKVIEVVLDRLAYGWSPEEIHFQHPDLSLARIYAALAYYYDHQSELDVEITRQDQEVRRLREQAGDSPLVTRLKASGLLS